MDFSTAIQEFRFDCKIRKLSAKTIDNYRKQLQYQQRYLADEHKITDVEAVRSIHIKQFLEMMDDKGRKARYINDLLKVFKTFFNCFDPEMTNSLIKETGKNAIAIEAPNYGVGIFLNENYGFGGYGTDNDTQIAFEQFVEKHKYELSAIREMTDDSGNFSYSAELILCGFIVDLEKNAYRNHLFQ